MTSTLLDGDNNPHQAVSKRSALAIVSWNRSETIIPIPLDVLGLPHRTNLKPRPMSHALQQDHIASAPHKNLSFFARVLDLAYVAFGVAQLCFP
ncbi:unnamed protein product [Heligmosomoides polygyrus]|uniref:Uncharacterized protein n=1 Tax=Heligmosomoides polygyrus TaxID=6339 RepID=A0A183GHZ0_HELPZ|nr:unnamed protein product [Heligmosomoides polygyrus]